MHVKILLATLSLLPNLVFSQTLLGAYIFHRHGDRQAKSLPPAFLTSLGYNQVYLSGQYLRQRYIASNTSGLQIAGISTDDVVQSQIEVSAPDDLVLMNSAQGFLQGLYPPTPSNNTLRNGTTVDAPMGGYQLIPIHTVTSTGSGSENSAWLQGSTGCANTLISSAEYFTTPEYFAIANSTASFYQGLESVISGVFSPSQASFKNAYASTSSFAFPHQHISYLIPSLRLPQRRRNPQCNPELYHPHPLRLRPNPDPSRHSRMELGL